MIVLADWRRMSPEWFLAATGFMEMPSGFLECFDPILGGNDLCRVVTGGHYLFYRSFDIVQPISIDVHKGDGAVLA